MYKRLIKILALILTIILILNIFMSCDLKPNEDIDTELKFTNVYKSQYFEQPEGYQINDTYVIDDNIFVCYYKDNNNILYKYDINGDIINIIDLNLDYYCKIIPSNDDMFYIAEPTMISKISNDGHLIWDYSITDKYNLQLTGLISLFIDYETNYLYILNSDILLILTSDGKFINLFYLEDYINSNSTASNILKTPNGQIIFEVSATNNISYYEVDLIKKTIVEYNMPNIHENFVNVYYNINYSDEYEFYYTTNTGLYGNHDHETTDILINWNNSDIEYNNAYWKIVSVINPETVLCVYSYNELVLLTRIPDNEVVPKTIISIATIGSTQLLQTIATKFNKQSDQYRVIIEDYAVYTDYDNGIYGDIKFNTDLMSGVIYDMIYFTGSMDIKTYIDKNMFVDLYELFEKDTDILELLKSKCETDGHLYTLPVTYYLTTMIGKQSQVGSKESLTVDELIEINNNLPMEKMLFSFSRSEVLNYYINASMNDYIDYNNAECDFLNDSFIDMIKLIKSLPIRNTGNKFYLMNESEKIEYTRNGDSYFMDFMVLSIYELLTLNYYYGNDEYVIKGFPNESGNGSILGSLNYVSIVKDSSNKDGAWEFIKFWLSDELQISQTFAYLPLTESALSKILDSYIERTYYTNGNDLVFYDEPLSDEEMNSYKYEKFYFNEEDKMRILRFFNNTNVSSMQNNIIIEIIKEEVTDYFSDAVTIEQCVEYIQNRVSIYLNEQY